MAYQERQQAGAGAPGRKRRAAGRSTAASSPRNRSILASPVFTHRFRYSQWRVHAGSSHLPPRQLPGENQAGAELVGVRPAAQRRAFQAQLQGLLPDGNAAGAQGGRGIAVKQLGQVLQGGLLTGVAVEKAENRQNQKEKGQGQARAVLGSRLPSGRRRRRRVAASPRSTPARSSQASAPQEKKTVRAPA